MKLINKKTFIFIFFFGLACGIIVHKKKPFPYKAVYKFFHDLIDPDGPWTIGMYEGEDLFNLKPMQSVNNPILTAKNVTDIDAQFVADPFFIYKDKKYTMFFEMLNRETNQGDIGYAESLDGKKWTYRKKIIDEPFHLSYPYVFKFEDNYYLIPESYQDASVRLYKAISFPDQWQYMGNLLTGHAFIDPSIFRHQDKWWLFTYEWDGMLNLFYADSLRGNWKPHPMNPIVKLNHKTSRPAGRVIIDNGKVFRFAQDGEDHYGKQVFAFEITELTEDSYTEKMITKPIIANTGTGWNAKGMHNIDLIRKNGKWMAVVDGRDN